MTTRVQKGGPIFKPVAKPRARPPSNARASPPELFSTLGMRDGILANSSLASESSVQRGTLDLPTSRESEAEESIWPSDPRTAPSTASNSPQAPPPLFSSVFPDGSQKIIHSSLRRNIPSTPPDSGLVESAATITTNNVQIDPALLEAVVTALQHSEQDMESSNGGPISVNAASTSLLGLNSTISQQPGSFDSSQPTTHSQIRAVSQNLAKEAGSEAGSENLMQPSKGRGRRAKHSGPTEGAHPEADNVAGLSKGRWPARRKKLSSTPAYDPEADPGEEIDPTSVTMGTLCDDQGHGRVSSRATLIVSNHAAWRAANRKQRAHLRASLEARKYGHGADEGLVISVHDIVDSAAPGNTTNPSTASEDLEPGLPTAIPSEGGRTKAENFDYSQAMTTSRYHVQVRIGPNGETIVDEESFFLDQNDGEDTSGYTHVEESDATKFVNSATYSKKPRGSRWSVEETELFYNALSQFGENYELISFVLPGRDRKACKNKFKAEDKKDPSRISHCLKHRRPYDIATLSRMTGKDFSGPSPVIRASVPTKVSAVPDGVRVTVDPEDIMEQGKGSQFTGGELLANLEDDELDRVLAQGIHS